MRKVITIQDNGAESIVYFPDTTYHNWEYGYKTEEEAREKEKEERDRSKAWEANTPDAKLDKLRFDLKDCLFIHPQTMATCSFDAIRIKKMVRVCQKFAEENKVYLDYY